MIKRYMHDIIIALESIASNKLKSVLTALGIISEKYPITRFGRKKSGEIFNYSSEFLSIQSIFRKSLVR